MAYFQVPCMHIHISIIHQSWILTYIYSTWTTIGSDSILQALAKWSTLRWHFIY
jgi:hypothetical protein